MFQTIARFLEDLFGASPATGGSRSCASLDLASESGASAHDTWASCQPAFNIDGTPMLGAFDAEGKAYGQMHSASEPAFNIDGTPMMGHFDANGHIFGDPAPVSFHDDGGFGSDSYSSYDSGSSFSGCDSWSTSVGCGSSDSFDSF